MNKIQGDSLRARENARRFSSPIHRCTYPRYLDICRGDGDHGRVRVAGHGANELGLSGALRAIQKRTFDSGAVKKGL